MSNPFDVVRQFERELCLYTGAPYAVAVTSCTAALLLSVAWHTRHSFFDLMGTEYTKRPTVSIPKKTYISVPMAIIQAGARPVFRDENWIGHYNLHPLAAVDSARFFTSGMYVKGWFLCVSFHTSKILADTQGGAILHDNAEADAWLRRARFDGRTEGVAPKDDRFEQIGWHCYLSPDVAARLLWKLSVLPKHNEPLPNDDYPDLSQMDIFK